MHLPLHVALLLVPLLIAMNAFCVVAEYAVVALRPGQINSLRKRGYRKVAGAMEKLKSSPASAIGAIQVCITMVNLLLGWIGEPAMSTLLERLFGVVIRAFPGFIYVSTALSFVVVTLLTVVLSELLPKALTLRFLEPAAIATALPILGVQKAIYPLVWLMNTLANAITRPLGLGRVDEMEGAEEITIEELRLLAARAGDTGVLSQRERALVVNALAIGKRRARDIMVPRPKVAYLDLQWALADNIEAMEAELRSRLPLCDGGLDKVVGVVKTKELLTAYHHSADVSVLLLIALKPVFAPENVPLDRLLTFFSENKTQFVFLVSEYGGVEGIVTLRDVVDELLGEIHEPSGLGKQHPHAADVERRGDELLVPGEMPVHELARLLDRPDWGAAGVASGAATVGGLVLARLQRLPRTGEVLQVDGTTLRVVDWDGRIVQRVGVRITPGP